MNIENMDMTNMDMEKRRYAKIKASGEYLELNIIIGVEDDEDLGKGLVSKSPVVCTVGHSCGPKEIGCLYMTLKSYMDKLREDYPTECFVAEMAMHVEDVGYASITKIEHVDDEED